MQDGCGERRALLTKSCVAGAAYRVLEKYSYFAESTTCATFSKFDWYKSGRIGLRALKALIVDELCIPMSPEDFVRLGALLDDQSSGAFPNRRS